MRDLDMGRNKGWNPQTGTGQFKCLDCGHTIVVYLAECKILDLQAMMVGHNEQCVPGNDKAPNFPVGLAFGMSIQLRDLFVMAQLSAKANVIVTANDAAFFYANADTLLAERDKDK
jgi:hypothetical protein